MITSSIRTDARRRNAGFSLTELVIASSLSLIVLAGVMSAFLMLARSGMNAANYSVAEAEIRRGIEDFSQNVRMASNVTWNSDHSVTLTLVTPNLYDSLTPATETSKVTYAFDDTTDMFYRQPGTPAGGRRPVILVRGVSSFGFSRFNRLDRPATTDAETKRIQISMNVRRTGATLVATNTNMVMASYILRNKLAN